MRTVHECCMQHFHIATQPTGAFWVLFVSRVHCFTWVACGLGASGEDCSGACPHTAACCSVKL
jgi:hypothetical protein